MKKKILIISTGAGAGHKMAAEAVRGTMLNHYNTVEVEHVDVLEYSTFVLKKIYPASYLAMINYVPHFWGYFYRQFETSKRALQVAEIRKMLSSVNAIKLYNKIKEFKPDYILHTHFLSVEILGQRKKYRNIPNGVVITDYDMHNFWIHKHVDQYFVASDEVKWVLQRKGINEDKIFVTGIPVRPQFTEKYSRQDLRKSLKIHDDEFVILLLGGGFGVGLIREALGIMHELPKDVKIRVVVITGKNTALQEQVQQIKMPRNVKKHVLGFTKNIDEYMKSADVIVGKAGGLTVSEALGVGTPMIIVAPIPGQEERNTLYLLEQGAALQADNELSLAFKLKKLIEEPSILAKMRRKVARIRRPEAALDISKKALSLD